jgi:hypothetical protein
MTTPTHGDYEISEVDGIESLKARMKEADTVRDWSFILSDYISFGNNKIAKNTGIFNFNSATDCPNAQTDNCQVPWQDCYAHKAENIYPNTLDYRRRQEYLRDSLDAETFAKAFLELVSRKRNEVVALRFSEAGDFRHNADIYWADRVAEILTENGIHVYTYSASNYLDWDYVEHLTVNQSNNFEDYGDRLYTAVPEEEDIPEDAFQCAYEKSDGEIKCGDCLMCVDKDFDSDIYITLH